MQLHNASKLHGHSGSGTRINKRDGCNLDAIDRNKDREG
jgi:hypothetical protein